MSVSCGRCGLRWSRNGGVNVTSCLVLCLALSGCHAIGPLSPDASAPITAGQPGAEVVVGANQFGQTVSVSMSQTLSVPRPAAADEWNVSFATEVLALLTPSDQVRKPGPEGWRFRSVAEGETALVFTTIAPPCAGDVPCPPAPPQQFAVTVRVTR